MKEGEEQSFAGGLSEIIYEKHLAQDPACTKYSVKCYYQRVLEMEKIKMTPDAISKVQEKTRGGEERVDRSMPQSGLGGLHLPSLGCYIHPILGQSIFAYFSS